MIRKLRFSLPALAVERPVSAAMLIIALSLLGVLSYRELPLQLMPNIALPRAFVVAYFPGAEMEEVERELVIPVEGEVERLAGVESVTSRIEAGQGVVEVVFEPDRDLDIAFHELQQRVQALRSRFPANTYLETQLFDTTQFSNFVMEVNLRGDVDPETIRRIAEQRVQPRLEAVDGVVQVSIAGGARAGVLVQIDPDRAEAHRVGFGDVRNAVQAMNRRREHLGEVTEPGRHLFATLEGRATTAGDLGNLVVRADGPVHLRDVADLTYGWRSETRYVRVDGQESLTIWVQKDEGSYLLKVADGLLDEIERVNDELADAGLHLLVTFDAGEEVRDELHRLQKLALAGAGLALVVLLAFLGNVRAVSIVALAIPVSVLLSFNLMWAAGLTLNVLTLLGLAVSVGMLLDNSIVVLENVVRLRTLGHTPKEAARLGGTEVQRAILAGTATTVAMFLPLAWLESEMQEVWTEFAMSVLFPLAASLLVALTLVPALASRLPATLVTPHPAAAWRSRAGALLSLLLRQSSRHPVWTIALVILGAIVSLAVCLILLGGTQERRRADDRVDIALDLRQGSTLEQTDKVAREIEAIAREMEKDVESIRADVREGEANITLELKERADEPERRSALKVEEELLKRTDSIPGARVNADSQRYASGAGGGGDEDAPDPFGMQGTVDRVILRSRDLQELVSLSEVPRDRGSMEGGEVYEVLRADPSVDRRTIRSDLRSPGPPELQIFPRRDELSLRGLQVQDLMGLVWATRRETETMVVPFRYRGEDVDLVLTVGDDASDRTVEDLENIRVLSPAGPVPLTELAQFRLDRAMVRQIKRKDGERQATIRFAFNQADTDTPGKLEDRRNALERALREIRLPEGTTLGYERSESDPILRNTLFLGALLILGVLAIAFESFTLGMLILYTLPFGLIGMLWGLGVTRVGLGATALLGAIVLIGLINNNGILLVDRARELFERGCPIGRATLQAARDRTRPVLMTASTTMLGMLPMAIQTDSQNEIWPPFAISVIGGMALGTLLTLVVLPTGFAVATQIRVWLRETPVWWILLTAVAWGSLLYYMYGPGAWITSEFWKILWFFCFFVPMWLLTAILPGRLIRSWRRKRERAEGPPAVSIRNATKVYGRPGRIGRSIQVARRREARKTREGEPIVTRASVLRSFLWKLPTLGVLVWALTDYLESWWWLTWCVWAVWWMVRTLARDEFYLWGHAPRDVERGRFGGAWLGVRGQLVRIALLALALYGLRYYPDWPWILVGILAGLLFLGSWIRYSGRLSREGAPPPQGSNPVAWLQRWMTGMVSEVPLLGRAREEVLALRGASLELGTGLFGLLGPNGAGKTTMLRMVAGVLSPTRGSILSCGAPPGATDRSRAGYLPQDAGTYEGMTAREYVEYNALLLGHTDTEERRRLVERALEAVGLGDRMDEKLGGFSGGMKQRAGIARALLDLPEVLVVDEPTAGLDPVERVRFRNLLSRIARDRVVLFSTHVVEDVETACEKLAVMEKGRIRYVGTTEEMREVARGRVWELDARKEEIPGIRERGKIVRSTRSNGLYRLRILAEEGPPGAVPVEESLEDAYLWLLREVPEPGGEEAADG